MHDISGRSLSKKRKPNSFVNIPNNLCFSWSLNDAFMVGNGMPMRTARPNFKTPPYVTAQPAVTHRKMSLLPTDSPESMTKRKRFLVLATDGLWDELR